MIPKITSEEYKILQQFFSAKELQVVNQYVTLLLEYNQKYNLISKNTIDNIWSRHIIDSAQILNYLPKKNIEIFDFGSGGGLPGIVMSIKNIAKINLVEKSNIKCIFLQNIIETLNLNAEIYNKILPFNIKTTLEKNIIVISRAFKSIDIILENIEQMKNFNVEQIILLKGQNFHQEIQKISKKFKKKWKIEINQSNFNNGKIVIATKFN